MKYLYIIENGKRNYSVCVPDLSGCVAAAKTIEETEQLIKESIEFHLEGMIENGGKLPLPSAGNSGFYEIKPAIKTNSKRVNRRKVSA